MNLLKIRARGCMRELCVREKARAREREGEKDRAHMTKREKDECVHLACERQREKREK